MCIRDRFEVEDCKVRLSTINGWRDCEDAFGYEFNWDYSPGLFSIRSLDDQIICLEDFDVWNDQCRKAVSVVSINPVAGGYMLVAELTPEFQLCMVECCGIFDFSFRGNKGGDPF